MLFVYGGTSCPLKGIDESMHKGLYTFGPSPVCGVFAFAHKVTREFNPHHGALLPAYTECARRGLITGWYKC